ncbi:MAG: hypothetical protein N2037_10840 [Acidimicrobiales bacterium]|nr:hypothetical protein [Acidimicrobiales bacterium]
MLYLLKGSRIREYHQQNVAILGAAEGEQFEIAYGARWVQPGLALKPGDGGVIVYSDSPYETFVPIRFATLEDVETDNVRTRLVVRVGPFVREGGFDVLQDHWQRFALSHPFRPGRVFLFEDENPGLLSPRSPAESDTAWRAAIDHLRDNEYFRDSSIARVLRILDHEQIPIDPSEPVAVGEPLTIEVELRTPGHEHPVELFVDAEPPNALDAEDGTEAAPNGVTAITVTPLLAGGLTGQISIRPMPASSNRQLLGPLVSSRPKFRLAVVEQIPSSETSAAAAATAAGLVPAVEIRRLVSRLEREADLPPKSWLSLYEDVFLQWAGEDPGLLAGYARHAYDVGEFARCANALQRISDRHPDDDFLYLLASLRAGLDVEVGQLLDRIDLNTNRDFERLLEAVPHIDPAVLDDLTQKVIDVLGYEKLVRFLEAVFVRLTSTQTAIALAEVAAYADPDLVASLLMERWPDAYLAPDRVVELLVDWEARLSKLAPHLEISISKAAEQQDWGQLDKLVEKARKLTGDDSLSLRCLAAHAYLGSGGTLIARRGFDLLFEVVNDAAVQGLLDLAVREAEALLGYAAAKGDDDMRMLVQELVDRINEALQSSIQFQAWREMKVDHRVEHLVKKVGGKTLHLVGGQREPWGDQLRDELKLADVRWHETEKAKGANLDWTDGLSADRDIVIVLWEFISHKVSTPLKQKCARAGIPRAEARTGRQHVVNALAHLLETAG